MEKIDFRKRNTNEELVLDDNAEEQCETDDNKMEQTKYDFEAKNVEHTEELRLHNDELHQFEDDKEKAH